MSATATTRPYYQLTEDLKAAYAAITTPDMKGLYLLKNNTYWDLVSTGYKIEDRFPNSFPHGVIEWGQIEFREGYVSISLTISGVTQMPENKSLPVNEHDAMLEFAVRMYDGLFLRGWKPVDVPGMQSQSQQVDSDWIVGADGAIIAQANSRLRYRCKFEYDCCPPIV